MMKKKDLKGVEFERFEDVVVKYGFEKYRAAQLFGWIHVKRAGGLDAVKNIPAPVKEALLQAGYDIIYPAMAEKTESRRDATVKFLFKAADSAAFEAVRIEDKGRETLCISSQSGCACACGFCATGKMGLKRNLETGEMIAQFYAAAGALGIKFDNLVFMGMGEPLLNWDNVSRAIDILSDRRGSNFSRSRITVSTCGITPVMKKIARMEPGFNLAVSVITADNEQRSKLMPVNVKYPLKGVVEAAAEFGRKAKGRLTFECVLFDGINDSLQHAEALAGLIRGINCRVNIIPYNSAAGTGYSRPDTLKALAFQKALKRRGVEAYIRKEKGADIKAACGQLAAGENNSQC
ncbi:MAG TPA: 23S rRNA (adenine(2503)-C(2))-methyltransferase RlmN [bacterium]|nr:23S rRNA (adenine(2503)-C(2))-methyltransferase RlmN [bacterium]